MYDKKYHIYLLREPQLPSRSSDAHQILYPDVIIISINGFWFKEVMFRIITTTTAQPLFPVQVKFSWLTFVKIILNLAKAEMIFLPSKCLFVFLTYTLTFLVMDIQLVQPIE